VTEFFLCAYSAAFVVISIYVFGDYAEIVSPPPCYDAFHQTLPMIVVGLLALDLSDSTPSQP
jgi:hypothetical protein